MLLQLISEPEHLGKYNSIINLNKLISYGIAPKLSNVSGVDQPRIEVLNPCDDGDDQKTPTTILFSNEGEFLGK